MKLQNVLRTGFPILALSLLSFSLGCAAESEELDDAQELLDESHLRTYKTASDTISPRDPANALDDAEDLSEEARKVDEAEQAFSICLEPYSTTTYTESYGCQANPMTSVNELHRLTYQTVSRYCRCPCGPDRLESSTTTLVGDYNTHQTATCPQ